jgi:hypothetical protein
VVAARRRDVHTVGTQKVETSHGPIARLTLRFTCDRATRQHDHRKLAKRRLPAWVRLLEHAQAASAAPSASVQSSTLGSRLRSTLSRRRLQGLVSRARINHSSFFLHFSDDLALRWWLIREADRGHLVSRQTKMKDLQSIAAIATSISPHNSVPGNTSNFHQVLLHSQRTSLSFPSTRILARINENVSDKIWLIDDLNRKIIEIRQFQLPRYRPRIVRQPRLVRFGR